MSAMPCAPKSMGGTGNALERRGGVSPGLLLSWGMVEVGS